MLAYQLPASELTLEEGLREYHENHSDLVSGRQASPTALEFFRCHDAAHVVFGCSTTLINEAMVKMWSFLGTTAGLTLLRDYRLPESQEIYRTLLWGDIARTALRSLVVVPRVMVRCRRMTRRWPWSDFDSYQKVPLVTLRREFGIEILTVV